MQQTSFSNCLILIFFPLCSYSTIASRVFSTLFRLSRFRQFTDKYRGQTSYLEIASINLVGLNNCGSFFFHFLIACLIVLAVTQTYAQIIVLLLPSLCSLIISSFLFSVIHCLENNFSYFFSN